MVVTGTWTPRPDVWFLRADGTVWNLKDLEGQLVDFELEIEDGFELEIG